MVTVNAQTIRACLSCIGVGFVLGMMYRDWRDAKKVLKQL